MYYKEYIFLVNNYIDTHITEKITLSNIAEAVHFSSYWLSRQYHESTGTTIMEYVRKKKMEKAAHELLFTNCNILDLSIKYGYDSQDAFCRIFKKYYGITPGKYKQGCNKAKDGLYRREDNYNMYDITVLENMNCELSERVELLQLVDKILQLSGEARRKGLLSLEEQRKSIQSGLLKKGIELIVDGTEPDIVREILFRYAVCGGNKGKELLANMIILEGITAIQQGLHTNLIREILLSFLGEETINEAENYFNLNTQEFDHYANSYIDEIIDKSLDVKECSLLESPLGNLNERSLQRLLRELDDDLIARAIKKSSGIIQAKILKNISSRQAYMIIDRLETMDMITDSDVIDAQKQVLDIMKWLINQGDICI